MARLPDLLSKPSNDTPGHARPSLRSMSLWAKLVILTLAIMALPVLTLCMVVRINTEQISRHAEQEAVELTQSGALQRLTVVRSAAQRQLEGLFARGQADLQMVADHVQRWPGRNATDGDREQIRRFADVYGYENVMVFDRDGACAFSLVGTPDNPIGLPDAKAGNAQLGNLLGNVLSTRELAAADFRGQVPGESAPLLVVAGPVTSEQGTIGRIVALQIPSERIAWILENRAGLGRSGETYLVGPDRPKQADNIAVREALAGTAGAVPLDGGHGERVLSAFAPVHVYGTPWALVVEQPEAEALRPTARMSENLVKATTALTMTVMMLASMTVLTNTVLAVFFFRMILMPIKPMVRSLKAMARGDYSQKLEVPPQRDELGQMAVAINEAIDNTRATVRMAVEQRQNEQESPEEPVGVS